MGPWKESRMKAGFSQEAIALELGVARKTVQNWEKGISHPTVDQAIAWFEALGISPMPYLLEYLYPGMGKLRQEGEGLASDQLREALVKIIDDLPEEAVRQLLFLFYGEHGSSPRGIMQLITAHLQTPMKDRVTQAGVVIHNYELALKKENLAAPDQIRPDLEFLKNALEEGEAAVLENREKYIVR